MKVFVNGSNQIKAVHHSDDTTLRAFETSAFDPPAYWPLTKILQYCYIEHSNSCSIYPYIPMPDGNASIEMGREQEKILATLGVPADENMEGHTAAARQAMDAAAELVPEDEEYEYKALYPFWNGDGMVYDAGFKVQNNAVDQQPYKCRQAHISQVDWAPESAPALWEPISEKHKGTVEDPIPAVLGMLYEQGKFYIESGTKYKYIWPLDLTLYHMPGELVQAGYFERVEG